MYLISTVSFNKTILSSHNMKFYKYVIIIMFHLINWESILIESFVYSSLIIGLIDFQNKITEVSANIFYSLKNKYWNSRGEGGKGTVSGGKQRHM